MAGIRGGLGSLFPGDNGITQTVNKIRSLIRFALRESPKVRVRAEAAIRSCAERDQRCEVESIFHWVLEHFKYTRDPIDLELVKDPNLVDDDVTRDGFFRGDCDDVAAYLGALLWSIGFPVQLVVIAVDGQGPEYRHIFVSVYLSSADEWMDLEATARQFPAGWSASSDRRREYPI
jgi:transglutaminase-like putative cysteine protease